MNSSPTSRGVCPDGFADFALAELTKTNLPGLRGATLLALLAQWGINTWLELGGLAEDEIKVILDKELPRMRKGEIKDLDNPELFGPGHIYVIEDWWKDARSDWLEGLIGNSTLEVVDESQDESQVVENPQGDRS